MLKICVLAFYYTGQILIVTDLIVFNTDKEIFKASDETHDNFMKNHFDRCGDCAMGFAVETTGWSEF